MTIKTFGSPLTYSKTETITKDTVLVSGQYYIFRKDKERVNCGSRAIVERAIDPVGIKEDFLARMKSGYDESPRVLYVKVSYDRVVDGIYGSFIIVDYGLEIHLQDMGSLSVAAVILILGLAIIIGVFLVATWLIFHLLDVLPEPFDWIFIVVVLIAFFILAVLFISGGRAGVSKKGVKLG